MQGKTVIVTGANSGMGLASTVELARRGANVVMACRSAERGKKALEIAQKQSASDKIELLMCDLGSLESIRRFSEQFKARYGVLDVLLNNAGVVSLKRQLTSDGFESQLGVNHLGHFLLTSLLLESLKSSKQGRIVNVSSGAHKIGKIHYDDPTLERGYNVAKAYAQSKLANILFTKGLAYRLKGSNVTANCLHPGAVATNIGIDRGTGFGKSVVALVRPFFLSAEEGAETAIYLATSAEVAGMTGYYFYKKKPQSLRGKIDNQEASDVFWDWSKQQVGLN